MDQSEITVQLRGGLGNQMFGAAAGLALAQRLDGRLRFDLGALQNDAKRHYALTQFNLRADLVTLDPKAKSNFSWRNLRSDGPQRWREKHFHYDPSFEELEGDIHISGYLQSPKYFASAQDAVRRAFDLKALATPTGLELAKAAKLAGTQSVAIHVRRGDYIDDPKAAKTHGALSADYYRRSIDLIKRSLPSPEIFLVTDDTRAARSLLEFAGEVTVAEHTTDYDDMFLISQCHHKIIANSSFSWWGAWLGEASTGLTIAPRQWFSREKLLKTAIFDLIPEDWVLL